MMIIISTIRSTTWLADCIVVALLLIAFKAGLSVIRMGIIRSNNGVI
jgi:nitrate reductase gamma subunit